MKTAQFLLGILADRLRERADETRKIEVRWRERAEDYSIAAASCTESAARHVDNLVSSPEEALRGAR